MTTLRDDTFPQTPWEWAREMVRETACGLPPEVVKDIAEGHAQEHIEAEHFDPSYIVPYVETFIEEYNAREELAHDDDQSR